MNKLYKQKGFTLVEMIVSLAIFAIVAVVAIGALLRIMTANQKAQNLQSAISNVSAVLEEFSRELRVGTNYHCETSSSITFTPGSLTTKACAQVSGHFDTSTEQEVLLYFDSNKKIVAAGAVAACKPIVAYRIITDSTNVVHFQKGITNKCTSIAPNDPNGSYANNSYLNGFFEDLFNTNELTITDFAIAVGPYNSSYSNGLNDGTTPSYPYVSLRLKGFAGDATHLRSKEDFDIQTTISSRTPQK